MVEARSLSLLPLVLVDLACEDAFFLKKAATARQLLSIRSATSSTGCVPSLFNKSCNSVGWLTSLATMAAPAGPSVRRGVSVQ